MKKLVIAGYYGFGNVGDDAVLASIRDDLEVLDPEISLTALTFEGLRRGVPEGVEVISMTDFQRVVGAIRDCDLLLLGGGGIFNNYLAYPDNLLWRRSRDLSCFGLVYGFPLLALLHGRPAMTIGAGASEINSDLARRDIGLGIAACSEVTLRDKRSAEILRGLPILGDKKITVTADPVFRLNNAAGPLAERLRAVPRPVVGVSLRQWDFYGDQERLETEVSAALADFQAAYGGTILFLPFDSGRAAGNLSDDDQVFDRVISRLPAGINVERPEGLLPPKEAAAALGECDLALTMRLHPTVMAVKNGVPFAALAYDQKVSALLADAGLEDCVLDPAAVDRRQLLGRLETLLREGRSVRSRLAAIAEERARAAYGNIEAVARLLAAPYSQPPEARHQDLTDFFMSYLRRNLKFLGDPTVPAATGLNAWHMRYEAWRSQSIPEAPLAPLPGRSVTTFDLTSPFGRPIAHGLMAGEIDFVRSLMAELSETPGAIVEFGVFQGDWLERLEDIRRELGQAREIWGFDSFQGLPEPQADRDSDCWSHGQYAADLAEVAGRLKVSVRPHIKLIPGWFADSLKSPEAQALKEVAFARIDSDLYQSAVEVLNFLADRLADRAILVFDDWLADLDRGESRAFAEWLPQCGMQFDFLAYNDPGHLYLRARRISPKRKEA